MLCAAVDELLNGLGAKLRPALRPCYDAGKSLSFVLHVDQLNFYWEQSDYEDRRMQGIQHLHTTMQSLARKVPALRGLNLDFRDRVIEEEPGFDDVVEKVRRKALRVYDEIKNLLGQPIEDLTRTRVIATPGHKDAPPVAVAVPSPKSAESQEINNRTDVAGTSAEDRSATANEQNAPSAAAVTEPPASAAPPATANAMGDAPTSSDDTVAPLGDKDASPVAVATESPASAALPVTANATGDAPTSSEESCTTPDQQSASAVAATPPPASAAPPATANATGDAPTSSEESSTTPDQQNAPSTAAATPSPESRRSDWCHTPDEERPEKFRFGPIEGKQKELCQWSRVERRQLMTKIKNGRLWIVKLHRMLYEMWFTLERDYINAIEAQKKEKEKKENSSGDSSTHQTVSPP
jgi:hypothetical protein